MSGQGTREERQKGRKIGGGTGKLVEAEIKERDREDQETEQEIGEQGERR